MNKDTMIAPLTFDLSEPLLAKIKRYQKALGISFQSEVIRQAIEEFDYGKFSESRERQHQVSVRLLEKQKLRLQKIASKRKISIGKLIRVALTALPEDPEGRGLSSQTVKTMARKPTKTTKKAVAKKTATKKVAAKKATATKKKVAAKKAVAKKVSTKKAAVKKTPAKKAATRKVATKKVVAKKVAAPAAKKATPAKKATRKTAAKKKS